MFLTHQSHKHIPLRACHRFLYFSTILDASQCQSLRSLAFKHVHLMLTSMNGTDILEKISTNGGVDFKE